MSILAIYGSPREKGNSSLLLDELLEGAKENNRSINKVMANDLQLDFCQGCLRCNLIKRCANGKDDWLPLSEKMMAANTLIFASPIYFHHLPAAVKKIIDRFRSFMGVQITEKDLKHTMWHEWQKHFIVILTQGSPNPVDSQAVVALFQFITETLCPQSRLTTIIGTRLALSGQVRMKLEDLERIYNKLQIPRHLLELDYHHNQRLLKQCYQLGKKL